VFLEQDDAAAGCRGLRRAFCGGEAFAGGLAERCFELCNVRLVNLYGPTETAIDATSHTCRPEAGDGQRQILPIGPPLHNRGVVLLDPKLRLVPKGLAGELLVCGPSLARGYLGRPALSAERFIPHPFASRPGDRLYRTGDLARQLPDGSLEFLG